MTAVLRLTKDAEAKGALIGAAPPLPPAAEAARGAPPTEARGRELLRSASVDARIGDGGRRFEEKEVPPEGSCECEAEGELAVTAEEESAAPTAASVSV